MSKRTPGPWLSFSAPYYDGGWQIETDDGYRVAMVPNVSGLPDNEANARLIAAAPELLEACQAARALTPDGTHTASVLDAAIAKATGAGHE